MRPILLAALAAVLPAFAGAHMTMETDEAADGSYWKAVLRVPHGCDGQATEAVEVTIPEGLIAVKPMPKPGWTLETETVSYAQSHDDNGKALTEGVRTIRWSGGSLPGEHYDEFAFRSRVAASVAPGTLLPVKAVQRCASAEVRWNEVAAAGQDPHDLARPAPLLRVAAPAGADAHAGSATVGDLTISGAVVRASIGNAPTSAAYMTITTAGEPDRLVAAASPAARAVELHTSLEEGGVSKMQRVEAIPVASDAPARLSPGDHHIMLIGLDAPLEEGTTVPLTLTFEKAGDVTLDVPVSKNVAAHAH